MYVSKVNNYSATIHSEAPPQSMRLLNNIHQTSGEHSGFKVICNLRTIIDHAEKKLLIFHLVDVVKKYDTILPNDPDKITWQDIYLANVIVARTANSYWQHLIGTSISDIPRGCDLISMRQSEWDNCKDVIRALFTPLLREKGIGCAVLTKALHRKRPYLLPICDNIVIEFLGIKHEKKNVETIIECMDRMRWIGITNIKKLDSIERFLEQWGMPKLTKVRMIDALCWMEGTERYQRLWNSMEAREWQLPVIPKPR